MSGCACKKKEKEKWVVQQDSNAQHMSFYKRRIKKSKGNVLQHVLSKFNTNALKGPEASSSKR